VKFTDREVAVRADCAHTTVLRRRLGRTRPRPEVEARIVRAIEELEDEHHEAELERRLGRACLAELRAVGAAR
jgi:hypothetical protein